MRAIAIAAALLAVATAVPAHAAVTPLALADKDASLALAGDTALFSREGLDEQRVLGVPADGSARASVRLQVPADGAADSLAVLAGSPQRAAVVALGVDPDTQRALAYEFSGPPAGPWPATDAPVDIESGTAYPVFAAVDGDRLFTATTLDAEHVAYNVREGAAPPVALGLPADAAFPHFAGDLAAFTDADKAAVTVLNWRTGERRTVTLSPLSEVEDLALRSDGTVAVDDGAGVLEIAPTGAIARVSKTGDSPVFAGDRLVYRDGRRLMIVDPGAAPRPFGVASASLGTVTADDRRVLWTANGCVLAADVTALAAPAPDAGACPRSELAIEQGRGYAKLRADRTIAFTATCVAAPGACHGSLHLALFAPEHGRSAEIRFSIPVGTRRRLVARLTRAAYVAARRAARNVIHEVTFDVRGATVDPDRRRNELNTGVMATVR